MASWLRGLPALLGMAAIYAMSAQTGDEVGSLLPLFRRLFPQMQDFNWGHFVAYFFLSLAYMWWFGRLSRAWKLLAVACCFLYGLTDEFHQMFVPGRTPDWSDIAHDVIGAALAALAVSPPFLHRLLRRWMPAGRAD